jgi:Zn-dependent protease with chaperone function
VIAFVLAFTGGLLYAMSRLGRVPIKLAGLLALVAIVSVSSMLKSLFFPPKEGEPGLKLDLAGEPKLRAMLDAVAAKIGTRAVDNVYMTPSTEVAVMERRNERCLVLGVAALDGLRVRPLKSILGHEYGHFTNRDTAGGTFALAVRRSLAFTAAGMEAGGADTWYNPAWWFVDTFHSLFMRISQGASRLREVLADRWAVFAYGADAFEEGLRHVVTRGVLFDMHVSTTLKEVVSERLPLANLYTYQPHGKQRDVSSLVESALSASSSVDDSHPTPAERFTLIRNLPQQEIATEEDDDAPASSLFTNYEALQMRMTAALREHVRARTGMEIPATAPLQSGA